MHSYSLPYAPISPGKFIDGLLLSVLFSSHKYTTVTSAYGHDTHTHKIQLLSPTDRYALGWGIIKCPPSVGLSICHVFTKSSLSPSLKKICSLNFQIIFMATKHAKHRFWPYSEKQDDHHTRFYLPPADRPGTGDYKMPDVCLCVRLCVCPCIGPFVTFYKMLHNSFVYEHKFTKLRQKVYLTKGMSFITIGLILKNKMAARAVFRLFFLLFPYPLTVAVF